MSWLVAFVGALLALGSVGARAASSGYHLLRTVELPDLTGWDYLSVDARTRQLFLSNNAGIIVLNADTLAREGTVPHPANLPGVGLVHGVAYADALGRGFVSREIPASVDLFDLHSLQPGGSAPTDPGTDAIVYDPASQRVFTMNGKVRGVHTVTVIDAVKARRLASIALPGVPEFAVVDGMGNLFVNIASLSELVRIDTRTLQITGQWPMAPCREPSGLAIDVAHHRLFAGCDNQIMAMIDADRGSVLSTVATGDGTDANRFDPGTGLAFSSNGESGTLTIAHEDDPNHLRLVKNLRTAPGARTMALDTTSHRLYLLTARFGSAPARPTRFNPHRYPVAISGSGKLLVFGP